jgi:hypothetical protein
MFYRYRRFVRDERGHAIVIGAIGMLIMAITVMASIGIGNGVYQKIKLQDAADAQAYSSAVKEARAYNFFAYTNRAMVVHYVAMMTFMAYVSFAQYMKNTVGRLAGVLQYIPYIGWIFKIIKQLIDKMYEIVDKIARLVVGSYYTPNDYLPAGVLDLANTALWIAQELVYFSTFGDLAKTSGATPGSKTDKKAQINADTIAGTITNYQNARGFLKAISDENDWYPGAGTNVRRKLVGKNNVPLSDPIYAHYRLVMSNIANAERPKWTTCNIGNGLWFIEREFHIHFGVCLEIHVDKTATTQIENFSITAIKDRINSNEALRVWIGWTCGFDETIFELTYNNNVAADYQGGFHQESLSWFGGPRQDKHHSWRGITPFMQGRTSWRNPASDHFNQPGNLAIATKPMTSDAAIQVLPMENQKFAINPGTGNMANSGQFDMTWKGQGENNGSILGFASRTGGMMATAAARAIYHRPGAWQEAPNFFNPLWEAHLTPVMAQSGMTPYLLYEPQLYLFGKMPGNGPGYIVH